MREILFRGKTERGRWIEGDLIHYQTGEVAIIEKLFSKYGYEAIEVFKRTLVLPNTICQYTGLTDKNGKKIFEGDIVKYGDTVHKVIFENRNKTAYFGLVYSPLETRPFGHYQDLRQIEVIGNIHDNPEILKKGEE